MSNHFLDFIDSEITGAFWKFAGSLLLFVIIILISRYKNMGMERQFIWAAVRGFTQILVLASFLTYIFQLEGVLPLIGVLSVMVTFGAKTAADRLLSVDGIFRIEFISLAISVGFVMTSMSLLRVLPTDEPAFWIPIGGMVTGNSMNISYLTLNRIASDSKTKQQEIEAALSIGAHPELILNELKIISTAMTVAITPSTNNLKALGLVFIPGLMAGLLIGGMHPIAAALLQVMIFFLLLGGGLLSALIGSSLLTPKLFDMENMSLKNR